MYFADIEIKIDLKNQNTGHTVNHFDPDMWKIIDISYHNDLPTNNRQVTSLSIVWPISKNGLVELMQLKNMGL